MVALDLERQTLELPSTKLMRRFRLWQTMEVLSQSVSHYCLIQYIGRKGEDAPIIGVVLIQPGKSLGLVRYDLGKTGLLPGSKSWKRIKEYLDLLQTAFDLGEGPTTVRDLERERADLAAIKPRWQRLIAFSPLATRLGHPEALVYSIYEECVTMTKIAYEEAPRVTFNHSETPTVCEFIRELAPVMSASQLITAARLTAEQVDEDAFSVKTVLLERMIRLLQVSDHRISPEQVERFMAAQERIMHLA